MCLYLLCKLGPHLNLFRGGFSVSLASIYPLLYCDKHIFNRVVLYLIYSNQILVGVVCVNTICMPTMWAICPKR